MRREHKITQNEKEREREREREREMLLTSVSLFTIFSEKSFTSSTLWPSQSLRKMTLYPTVRKKYDVFQNILQGGSKQLTSFK